MFQGLQKLLIDWNIYKNGTNCQRSTRVNFYNKEITNQGTVLSRTVLTYKPTRMQQGFQRWLQKMKRRKKGNSVAPWPNQQSSLNKLLTEFRCGNFVDKHGLSKQIGAKRAKMCMQCVHIPNEPPFLHTTVGGWGDFATGKITRLNWFFPLSLACAVCSSATRDNVIGSFFWKEGRNNFQELGKPILLLCRHFIWNGKIAKVSCHSNKLTKLSEIIE